MKIAFVYNLKRNENLEEAEFDTEETINSITTALASRGDTVHQVEMTKNGSWISELINIQPDLVFNTAEGFEGIGREALAPTVFDQLKVHYVGSGPYACFLTLDKFLTKKVVENKGVPVAEGFFISSQNEIELLAKELDYPVFVKPNFEGSSKGITLRSKCNDAQSFLEYGTESLTNFPQGLLVEKYIDGKDITVPFINGIGKSGVLEPMEYTGINRSGDYIYDYELKNSDDEKVGIRCPADIDSKVRKKLVKYMDSIINALGINDMARADFRVTPTGDIYFIEINALPSLQEGAGIFAATSQLEMDYNTTIQKIIKSAVQRGKRSGIKRVRKLRRRDPQIALVYNVKKKKAGDEGYEQEAEFDAQTTIDSIAHAIEANGYNCTLIEANRDLSQNLQTQNIDIVFNIAEGMNKKSREAQVPALCDLLGIEHTGSDAACLSMTLNKSLSTKVVGFEGLNVPASTLINPQKKKNAHNLRYPIILKPNLEGSSKGIYSNSVVNSDEELQNLLESHYRDFHDLILAEEYVTGREFTVGIVGNRNPRIVGISEIVFKNNQQFPVYSYELKQIEDPFNNSEFAIQSPPDISQKLKAKLHKTTKRIFEVTGCRDVARVDFKVTDKDEIYFIEVNPLPGLTPNFSDLPVLASRNGMSYQELIGSIMKPAIARWRKRV